MSLLDTLQLDDISPELMEEYKRFMKLKIESKDYNQPFQLSPSYFVDKVWHLHLLETDDYQKFCDENGGFFHHTEKSTNDNKETRYENTLKLYQTRYKMEPPVKYWPSVEDEVGYQCCICLGYFNKPELYVNEKIARCKTHHMCDLCVKNYNKSECPMCGCERFKTYEIKFINMHNKKEKYLGTINEYDYRTMDCDDMKYRLKATFGIYQDIPNNKFVFIKDKKILNDSDKMIDDFNKKKNQVYFMIAA